MRRPLLLVLVIFGASFLGLKTWEKAQFFFAETQDCGVLVDRVRTIDNPPKDQVPFKHDTYCKLAGTVQMLNAYATPKKDGSQPGIGGQIETLRELEGVKYYVKLAGDNVFAILPADRMDVHKYRVKKQGLFGFSFHETGRIIEPKREGRYIRTGRFLQLKFAIPEGQPVFIFNVNEHPGDRLKYLVIVGLMGLTILLALFGLLRIIRIRLRS